MYEVSLIIFLVLAAPCKPGLTVTETVVFTSVHTLDLVFQKQGCVVFLVLTDDVVIT